jgi:hypothetical protein
MRWMLAPDDDRDDAARIDELLHRAQAEIGGPPLVRTRFLYDAGEMLRATRLIEDTVHGVETRLYVGFQTAGKLDGEHRVYERLTRGGTDVQGFGVGRPHDAAGVSWHALGATEALAGQWFLVAEAPEPIAFVGFERSPMAARGVGGALDVAKTWVGFVSDDARLVAALAAHLAAVAAGEVGPEGEQPGTAEERRTSVDGPLYLIATDEGSSALGAVRAEGLRRAAADGARVLLYDRAAESRLHEPYDIGPWGGEAHGVGPSSRLEPDVLEGLGRRYLADQLRLVRAQGIDAQAFLPLGVGAKAVADAARRFAPDLLFLPSAMAEPRLVDRVTRNTLDDVELSGEVKLVEPTG